MLVIRDLPSTQQISDPAIRNLVQQRIDDLGGHKFNATELGYFLVIESLKFDTSEPFFRSSTVRGSMKSTGYASFPS